MLTYYTEITKNGTVSRIPARDFYDAVHFMYAVQQTCDKVRIIGYGQNCKTARQIAELM